ncbi:unnamed protein product [Ranitomeya imitator]|uniref:MADF domain-containing protein n=1 Tax=Ranitomeya imitator TaxID=111125 RepID=A0ABN9L489_9NEOB|nr:unnamed protein product [Ranitomeya imitator]
MGRVIVGVAWKNGAKVEPDPHRYYYVREICPSTRKVRLLVWDGGGRRNRPPEEEQEQLEAIRQNLVGNMMSGGRPEEGKKTAAVPANGNRAKPYQAEVLGAEVKELCRQLRSLWHRATTGNEERRRGQPPEPQSAEEETGTGDAAEAGNYVSPAPVAEEPLLVTVDSPPPPPPGQTVNIQGEWVTFKWTHATRHYQPDRVPWRGPARGEKIEVVRLAEYQRQETLRQEQRETEHRRQSDREKDLQTKAWARQMSREDWGPQRYGTVVTFRLQGGWGFIKEPGLYPEVFGNRRDVEAHLMEDTQAGICTLVTVSGSKMAAASGSCREVASLRLLRAGAGKPEVHMSYNSEEFVRELIEMYRSLPCLWQIKSAEYSNRNKKREAYGKLVALFKQHNPCEKVDESVVRKKIQGLRTVYKKELNKVVKSMKSGAATDEVYVPSLWYYDLLGFTRDQELPRTMVSSMRQTLDQDPVIPTDTPVGDQDRHDLSSATSDDMLGDEPSMAEATEGSSEDPAPSTLNSATVPRRINNVRRRKDTLLPSTELVCLAKQMLSQQSNTSVDSFANFAADCLGKLEDTQRIHVERVIFETLSKAAAGQLDETSTVHSWMECDRCSRQSMTQTPEAMRSTPVHRILPHQNLPLAPPPQYPRFSHSFLAQLSSPPSQGFLHAENQYEEL